MDIGDCFAPFDGRSYVRLKRHQGLSKIYGDKGINEEEKKKKRKIEEGCIAYI